MGFKKIQQLLKTYEVADKEYDYEGGEFDEADDIMCESCKDAVAVHLIGRGLGEQEVCTDCYYEIGDRGY